MLYGVVTPPKEADGPTGTELAVLDIPMRRSARVGDVPKNAQIMGFCWSPDGKRIAYSWRQTHAGKPADLRSEETESHLVVCDPDGKNAKTVVRAKDPNPWAVTIGQLDWR